VIDKVADLINPLTGIWDEELIREVFFGVLMLIEFWRYRSHQVVCRIL
jgi:hypothetical protein